MMMMMMMMMIMMMMMMMMMMSFVSWAVIDAHFKTSTWEAEKGGSL